MAAGSRTPRHTIPGAWCTTSHHAAAAASLASLAMQKALVLVLLASDIGSQILKWRNGMTHVAFELQLQAYASMLQHMLSRPR
jgi:hypothetical protein